MLPKGDNLLLHLCQRKMGAKIPRQSSLRLWLRSAAIHLYERFLQNGAQTQGPQPHPFFAPYSVSSQQSPEQSYEISFLARNADGTAVSIPQSMGNVNQEIIPEQPVHVQIIVWRAVAHAPGPPRLRGGRARRAGGGNRATLISGGQKSESLPIGDKSAYLLWGSILSKAAAHTPPGLRPHPS